jgi:uncharacterized protein YqgQ
MKGKRFYIVADKSKEFGFVCSFSIRSRDIEKMGRSKREYTVVINSDPLTTKPALYAELLLQRHREAYKVMADMAMDYFKSGFLSGKIHINSLSNIIEIWSEEV